MEFGLGPNFQATNNPHPLLAHCLSTFSKPLGVYGDALCLPATGPGTLCGKDGEVCKCHGTVKYGAHQYWTEKKVNGQITCNAAAFDGVDPSGAGENNSCFCTPSMPVQPLSI